MPGVLAVTVSDSVRVRSQPRVANDSRKYEPVLPTGAQLMVMGGPVVASGYTWIEVSPLSTALEGGVDRGWVAVADHDGTPWVALDPNPTPGFELASTSSSRQAGSLAAAKVEASAANAFGVDLYRKLVSSGEVAASKGLVFSPTSIVDALAMARAGANGTTATQMDKVLHVFSWDQLGLGVASLDAQLASRDGAWADQDGKLHALSLRLANMAFAQRGFPVRPAYLDRLGKTFGAGVALVDFAADPAGAADAINGWVRRQTVGKIPVIVSTDQVRGWALALANAIYLKANWAREFRPDLTDTATFTAASGSKADVQMMRQWGGRSLGLASGTGWKATELDYAGPGGTPLAMTLILPDDIRAFERSLSAGLLATVQSKIAAEERRVAVVSDVGMCGTFPYEVVLGLPRFGVDWGTDIKTVLGAMGMPDAVTPGKADFTGMNPDAGLFIGAVIHKATVDVDEKGTTAAAATVVGMDTTGGCGGPEPLKTVQLTFNRPFVFVIRDVKTGAILFLGRVMDPTKR